MFYVYVLFSKKDRKLYIGLTHSLNRRLKEHKFGDVKSTKDRRPLILIYYECYTEKEDAERREKYLKGGNGRGQLKIQLQNNLKTIGYKFI
jgi:putative endonuclease